ncbi:MAG: acyl-CoA dehydrogenase, partial [Erythrobacter sp.]|nr:acyl-CoA dehydrogenase [Erythrobacter sp.]
MSEWIERARAACRAASAYRDAARDAVARDVAPEGKPDPALIEREQRQVHGFGWIGTLVAALEATADWAARSSTGGRFGEVEALVLKIGCGEYLHQLISALPMSQNEMLRPGDLGISEATETLAADSEVRHFLEQGNNAANRAALARALGEGTVPDEAFGDETLDMIRAQFRAFTADRIAPHAHRWHLEDKLIPIETVREMADLGVFG